MARLLLQVHVYSKPIDAHIWSEQTASVLIITYDMLIRLKSQAVNATLKAAGDAPTEKVLLTCLHIPSVSKQHQSQLYSAA